MAAHPSASATYQSKPARRRFFADPWMDDVEVVDETLRPGRRNEPPWYTLTQTAKLDCVDPQAGRFL
jgi:hypothetical protein